MFFCCFYRRNDQKPSGNIKKINANLGFARSWCLVKVSARKTLEMAGAISMVRPTSLIDKKKNGHLSVSVSFFWVREMGSNHRPSGYEPDELPLLHPAIFGAPQRSYSITHPTAKSQVLFRKIFLRFIFSAFDVA